MDTPTTMNEATRRVDQAMQSNLSGMMGGMGLPGF